MFNYSIIQSLVISKAKTPQYIYVLKCKLIYRYFISDTTNTTTITDDSVANVRCKSATYYYTNGPHSSCCTCPNHWHIATSDNSVTTSLV